MVDPRIKIYGDCEPSLVSERVRGLAEAGDEGCHRLGVAAHAVLAVCWQCVSALARPGRHEVLIRTAVSDDPIMLIVSGMARHEPRLWL